MRRQLTWPPTEWPAYHRLRNSKACKWDLSAHAGPLWRIRDQPTTGWCEGVFAHSSPGYHSASSRRSTNIVPQPIKIVGSLKQLDDFTPSGFLADYNTVKSEAYIFIIGHKKSTSTPDNIRKRISGVKSSTSASTCSYFGAQAALYLNYLGRRCRGFSGTGLPNSKISDSLLK